MRKATADTATLGGRRKKPGRRKYLPSQSSHPGLPQEPEELCFCPIVFHVQQGSCPGIRKPAGKAPSPLLRLQVGCPELSPLPKVTPRATALRRRSPAAGRASLTCPGEELRHGEPMRQPPNLQPHNNQTLRCGTALSGPAGTPPGHAAVRPPPASPPAPDNSSAETLLETAIPLGTVSGEPRSSGSARTRREVGGRRKAGPARYQILTITPHRHERTAAGERSVLRTHPSTFPFAARRKEKLCERGVLKLGGGN